MVMAVAALAAAVAVAAPTQCSTALLARAGHRAKLPTLLVQTLNHRRRAARFSTATSSLAPLSHTIPSPLLVRQPLCNHQRVSIHRRDMKTTWSLREPARHPRPPQPQLLRIAATSPALPSFKAARSATLAAIQAATRLSPPAAMRPGTTVSTRDRSRTAVLFRAVRRAFLDRTMPSPTFAPATHSQRIAPSERTKRLIPAVILLPPLHLPTMLNPMRTPRWDVELSKRAPPLPSCGTARSRGL